VLTIAIPGNATLNLAHLVLDYNGTIALDGVLLPGTAERLAVLADNLDIHIVTADTHGTVAAMVEQLPCDLRVIGPDRQDAAKAAIIEHLGAKTCAAIGNGRNDGLMLAAAALGIGIMGAEGACAKLICQADILCPSMEAALDLLIKPDRLRATLRN